MENLFEKAEKNFVQTQFLYRKDIVLILKNLLNAAKFAVVIAKDGDSLGFLLLLCLVFCLLNLLISLQSYHEGGAFGCVFVERQTE